MTGRHTQPIQIRTDDQWAAHVRNTRSAALTVGALFALSVGVLIALILDRTGVI